MVLGAGGGTRVSDEAHRNACEHERLHDGLYGVRFTQLQRFEIIAADADGAVYHVREGFTVVFVIHDM